MLTKNSFVGYEVEEPVDQFFIIKDFMNHNEQETLLNYLESLSQQDWEFEYYLGLKSFCLRKFGTDDIDMLIKEGKFEITENWIDKNVNVTKNVITKTICTRLNKQLNSFLPDDIHTGGPAVVQRQYAGVPLIAHHDQHTDPSIVYAAIIYLNENYTEGELFLSNKNFTVKPPARSLVIFPGTEEFTHGVNAPGEGPVRYVMPSFISKKGFYEDGKYYV